jgi:uncharacterized membrane protein
LTNYYFCRDGCTRCGIFLATSLVIAQKEMDEEVDIFQVVRRIQTRRPALLSSFVSLMHLIYEKVIVGVIIFVDSLMILKLTCS